MTLSALSNVNMANSQAVSSLRPSQRSSATASLSAVNQDSMELRFGAASQPAAPKKKYASILSIGAKLAGGATLSVIGMALTLSVVGAPIGIPMEIAGAGLMLWGGYQAYRRIKG